MGVQVPADDDAAVTYALRKAGVAVIVGPIDDRFLNAPKLHWLLRASRDPRGPRSSTAA
jgi:hypothetical protein